ncbi:MAG: exodeoxyribonuclease III [Crocosphaera sp.]|nr:exodeoxyribonuclease III [Crocosphaera sp.]
MKIATWNVNSIRTRQPHIINWLNNNFIDVLCLQETKVIDKDFPREPFENLGYHTYIYGQKAYNGVAIFSRKPMTNIITGFTSVVGEEIAENFDEQKRVISGVIDDIRVINLYVPNGASIGSDKYEYKLQWFKVLKNYIDVLRQQESYELCICGDFNIALEDKDIYNSKGKENHIMSSALEREALHNILEIGLKDAFRKFTTEGGHFSWWDYRSGGFQRNRGWRIDHLYLTNKLYEKTVSCIIDIEPRKQERPSDHTPVIVEI